MGRHIPEPLDAAGLHGDVGVEALGDRVADERLTLLLEEFDQPLLLGDQGVDSGDLALQESQNPMLFCERR